MGGSPVFRPCVQVSISSFLEEVVNDTLAIGAMAQHLGSVARLAGSLCTYHFTVVFNAGSCSLCLTRRSQMAQFVVWVCVGEKTHSLVLSVSYN